MSRWISPNLSLSFSPLSMSIVLVYVRKHLSSPRCWWNRPFYLRLPFHFSRLSRPRVFYLVNESWLTHCSTKTNQRRSVQMSMTVLPPSIGSREWTSNDRACWTWIRFVLSSWLMTTQRRYPRNLCNNPPTPRRIQRDGNNFRPMTRIEHRRIRRSKPSSQNELFVYLAWRRKITRRNQRLLIYAHFSMIKVNVLWRNSPSSVNITAPWLFKGRRWTWLDLTWIDWVSDWLSSISCWLFSLSLVEIDRRQVTVYPNETDRPSEGEELNCQAIISLLGVYPIDRSKCNHGGEEVTDPDRLIAMKYRDYLEEMTRKFHGQFLNYDVHTGTWTFQVEHF